LLAAFRVGDVNAAPAPLVAASAKSAGGAYNGGRSQINVSDLQSGGSFPFLNLLKTAQTWSLNDNSGLPEPNTLDDDGYPTKITNGGVYTVFFAPSQAARPGNYVITWTGNGTLRLGMSNTPVSGSLTSTGGSGRFVFSTTETRFVLSILAIGTPRVTNLQVFHVDDESALKNGQVFGTRFKQRLQEANFGVVRFLAWQSANTTNVTTWATRRPVSYFTYSGSELRPALYCGATSVSANGLTFAARAPTSWSGLADKATVIVKFASAAKATQVSFTAGTASISMPEHKLSVGARLHFTKLSSAVMPSGFTAFGNVLYHVVAVPDSNTIQVASTAKGPAIVAGTAASGSIYANPVLTLNVGGSGDVDIRDAYSNYLSGYSNSYPAADYRSIATLVYDATLNSWIKQGGGTDTGGRGLDNGCPPELMVRLCSEIGAHPYFVTPPLAIDPATDFMPKLAAYCRDTGPSWMIPRFEGPNELWNTAGGFYQTTYANNKAKAYWGGDFDYNNWYGKVMSVLGQAISTVYSDNRTRYQVICGVQTALGSSVAGTKSSNDRLASTKYLSQSASPQAPYTKSPAAKWVTHICCAQYYRPSEYNTSDEQTRANTFVSALGKGDLQQSLASAYALTSSQGLGSFTLPKCAAMYANWKAWAKSYGITRMCGYEGGYSPDYTGGGKSPVDLLRSASKQAAALYTFTITNYNSFIGLSDATFSAEFPSHLTLSGQNPSTNVWSLLEDIYQAPNPPQWAAIVAFNRGS
jgi:hypothetical protein